MISLPTPPPPPSSSLPRPITEYIHKRIQVFREIHVYIYRRELFRGNVIYFPFIHVELIILRKIRIHYKKMFYAMIIH